MPEKANLPDQSGERWMRTLTLPIVGLLGAFCLSSPAMAQNRNKVVIRLNNKTNHSVTLLNVNSIPKEKSWSWSPQDVAPNNSGLFSAYWDDNQGPTTTVEFEGTTSGPYGCLLKCSVEVKIPLYEAVISQSGLQCSSKKPDDPKITNTPSDRSGCSHTNCALAIQPAWNSDTCNYALNVDYKDPDHFD